MRCRIVFIFLILLLVSCTLGQSIDNNAIQKSTRIEEEDGSGFIQYTPMPDSGVKLKFGYPDSWVITEVHEYGNETKVYFEDPETRNEIWDANFVSIDNDKADEVDNAIEDSIQGYRESLQGFDDPSYNADIEEGEIWIDGRKSKILRIQLKYREGESGEEHPRYRIVVYIPSTGQYYQVHLVISTENIGKQLMQDFMKMLETIVVLD